MVPGSSEKVRIMNDFGTLEGTLALPDHCGRVPVVLILSGSGSSDRNGDTPQMYRELAEALLAEGIGALRYDDEGVNGSATAAPASVVDFRYDMEVADAARWIDFMRADERIGSLIVAGHSQGSLTAILASKTSPIDAFVSLSGAGRPAGELLHEQLESHLTPPELAELDDAIAKLDAGVLPGPMNPPLDQILPVEEQPYLVSWLKWDPKVEIQSLAAPALLIQGKVDIQVTVHDAELLQEGDPGAKLVLIDDMCHVLKQATMAPASQKKAYNDPSVPLAPELVPAIVSFISDLP
jgi:hypothetical protein